MGHKQPELPSKGKEVFANQELSVGLSQVLNFLLSRPDGKASNKKAHYCLYLAILIHQEPESACWSPVFTKGSNKWDSLKENNGHNTGARKVGGPGKSHSNFSVV